MEKQIMILTDDYWHHADSIAPMLPLLFNDDTEVIFTKDPRVFLKHTPDLLISFKDPVENDQIPTPVWCDEEWTGALLTCIRDGMGFLGMHAGLTDLPEGHPLLTEVIRSRFVTHPAPCEVTFVPDVRHPILEGIPEFTFPTPDEHYMMEFYDDLPTTVLAHTVSTNGTQPALWVHESGKGRICCMTPGHNTENLTFPPYIALVRNAIRWCLG